MATTYSSSEDKELTEGVIFTASELWSVNITKMHFQHSACFQLRNWAFGITGVVIPLIWVGNVPLFTKILLHVFTILLMGLILQKDFSWHGYHDMYRDRARLCEGVILGKIEMNSLVERYFELKPTTNIQQLKSALLPRHLLLLQTDFVELYLILFLGLSLVVTMITA